MSRHYKGDRILSLYLRMLDGESIHKLNYTLEEGVTPRTFDRDIQTLRNCLSEHYLGVEVLYDKARDSYRISDLPTAGSLSFVEGYLLLKALLHDQILRDDEIAGLADSILPLIRGPDRKALQEIFQGDILRYVSPPHGQALMKLMEDLLLVIRKQQKICLRYDLGAGQHKKNVLPLALEHGENEVYFLFSVDQDGGGAAIELSKIHSFTLLSAHFSMDENLRMQQEEMSRAIQNGLQENYKIKEMI